VLFPVRGQSREQGTIAVPRTQPCCSNAAWAAAVHVLPGEGYLGLVATAIGDTLDDLIDIADLGSCLPDTAAARIGHPPAGMIRYEQAGRGRAFQAVYPRGDMPCSMT
jgi:hypothetical protein